MNLIFLTEYFIPIVLAACLIIGYIIKNALDFISNKYIPSYWQLQEPCLHVQQIQM